MPVVNPGIRRQVAGAITRLFNSAAFSAPLTHSLVPERGTGSPTFTRASTATFTDWESVLRTVPSGCARFEGGRMVRNLLTGSSENLTNAVWGNGSVSLVANAALSPRGDVTASKVIPTALNATVYQLVSSKLMSGYGKGDAFSWIAVVNVAGSAGAAWFNLTTGTVGTVVAGYTATIEPDENGFYRWSLKKDDGTSFAAYQLLVTDGDNSGAVTPNGTDGIFLWGHQLEDVTGQADQTASEYVSVGVESAPAYHGSMVDGVKCYDTDRSGNPISTSGSYPLVGYVPWPARTNHFLTSSVPATQTSGALSTGTYTLWMTGTGSVAVAGNTATITGAGTATDGSPVTFVVTVGGTVDYTVTGSPTKAQSENGAYQSPYILTAGAAVARNADVDQYPTTAGPIAAVGAISLDFTPYHPPSGTIALWGTYVDASNYTAILHDATNLIFRKRIAGSNYDATIANAFSSGTTYKIAATWGVAGTAIYLDGVAGTPHANTTAAQIAATMQVGADGNSLQQPGAGTTNLRIWQRQLSSPEGVAVTA